jgi:osmotically-inducible protein OsmY
MTHDSDLKTRVTDELKWEPSVTSAHIGVIAEDGVVTLTGHVENYAAKYAAEKAALRVWGVKGIAQEIEVRLPMHLKRADDEIATAALHRLSWDGSLDQNDIKVKVDKGWLTLTGVVDWHYQSEFAEQDVRRMQGVVGVINKITLKPRINVANVAADIEYALHRSRFAPKTITVRAEDSKVVLTGTVHSWADKQTAGATAWAAPGAMNVQNNLMVA